MSVDIDIKACTILERFGAELLDAQVDYCCTQDLHEFSITREGLTHEVGFTELVLTTSGAAQELGPGAKALGTTLKPDSKVEVRTVSKRYVFVDGEPMAEPLDD